MLKKGIALLTGILIVYAALVATHRGEFWPFSIYPMFSQGGRPWVHVLVRKLPPGAVDISWNIKSRKNLPGNTFGLSKVKFDQTDLAAYLNKRKQWNNRQIKNLRAYFQSKLDKNSFLIFKARGRITNGAGNSVTVAYTPFILIREDTTLFNPRIYDSQAKQ